jgi:hypothetical protein
MASAPPSSFTVDLDGVLPELHFSRKDAAVTALTNPKRFTLGVDYIVAPSVGTKGKPRKRYLLTQAAYDRWVLHPSTGKKRRPRAPAPTFAAAAAAPREEEEDEEPLSPSALDEYVCRDDGEEPLTRARAAPVLTDSPSSPSSSAGPAAAMVIEDEAPAAATVPDPKEGLQEIKVIIDAAFASKEKLPVTIEESWRALGYSTKGNAVVAVTKKFIEGMDALFEPLKGGF